MFEREVLFYHRYMTEMLFVCTEIVVVADQMVLTSSSEHSEEKKLTSFSCTFCHRLDAENIK